MRGESSGVVISREGERHVRVSFSLSACSACGAGFACGGVQDGSILAFNACNAVPGQRVRIREDGAFTTWIYLLIFGLPLLAFIGSVIGTDYLLPGPHGAYHDPLLFGAGIIGLLLGGGIASGLLRLFKNLFSKVFIAEFVLPGNGGSVETTAEQN